MRMKTMAAAVAAGLVLCLAQAAEAEDRPIYRIVDRIAGRDGGWDFAAVDAATGRLYVARGDGVERIDLATRQVVDPLAPARHAHQVLTLDGGRTLMVTEGDAGTARFYAAGTGGLIAEVRTGAKPDAAFFDAATGRIAVMNADDGTVALIDARTRALVGRIQVGGALEFGVPDGVGGAFVNVEDANAIARLDLRTGRRTGTIALPGCEGPTGLAIVASGTRLISACANGVALVIDARSGRTLATLEIGTDPDAVLVDERRKLAFVPCGGTGTLVAIGIADPGRIAVVDVFPTQRGAKTGALDPRDGRVYLPVATLAPVATGEKRGKPIPGTFTVLVLAPDAKKSGLQFLEATRFAPDGLLPAPPPRGSAAEALELKRVHALMDAAGPDGAARATADDRNETPSIFDAVTGRNLDALPNVHALLRLVDEETAAAISLGKDHFGRTRPWGVDATIRPCEDVAGKKPTRGYPSGHAGLGWSVGWTLAQLMPQRAGAILTRAREYAVNREVCGVHFASDTEASHVVGTLAASTLFADPRLSGLVEAARRELAGAPRR
jgi:hypothetical protein